MTKYFLLFIGFISVNQVDAQKLIAAYQFKKDTLFRFHYNNEVIIKNSNELRLWMENQDHPMDSTLFEYIVYQLGVLPQRLIPCPSVPTTSFTTTPTSFLSSSVPQGCTSGAYQVCTKDNSKLPPCIITELEHLGIEVDLSNESDYSVYESVETKSNYGASDQVKQRLNKMFTKIQKGWHREFPIKNDSFYTSLINNIQYSDSVYLLYLSGQNLRKVPEDIKYFKNITELYLLDNQLTELPRYLFELKNLRILHLGNNQITHIPPEIANLQKLEHIYLDNNPIQGFPSEFFTLPRLINISLNYTNVSKITKDFANFTWLQKLDLRGVNVEHISTDLMQLLFLDSINIHEMSPIIWEEETAKTLPALRVFICDY